MTEIGWFAPTHTVYTDTSQAQGPHVVESGRDADGTWFRTCEPFLTVAEIRDGKRYRCTGSPCIGILRQPSQDAR